jgi:hypothetical protein
LLSHNFPSLESAKLSSNSGLCSIKRNKVRAAPDGRFRRCSQLRKVFGGMPRALAKLFLSPPRSLCSENQEQ